VKEIKAYIKTDRVERVVEALEKAEAPGITVVEVHPVRYGFDANYFSRSRGATKYYSGKIVKFKNGKAVVQMETGSQCNHCAARHACSVIDGAARQIEIPVENSIHINDQVTLSYQAKSRIISALLVFILPIIFLIAGYFVGFEVFSSEGKAILSSIAGLIFAFVLLWGLNKILAKGQCFLPTVLKTR